MKSKTLLLLAALLALPLTAPGRDAAEVPRLSGIVSLPNIKEALFEFPDSPCCGPRQIVVGENEDMWGVKVLRILPDRRSVEVSVNGAAAPLTLTLNIGSNTPPSAAASIELDKARLLSVLELYGRFSERTLLYWPSLPPTSVSLKANPRTAADLAQVLKETLAKNGVTSIADGERFEMMVPRDEVNAVKPHPPSTNPPGTAKPDQSERNKVVIDFYGTDLVQVFYIYAGLVGGEFDRTAPIPAVVQPFIWMHAKPGLSELDGVYALDTLLGWRGITMVRSTNGLVRAVHEPRK